jgi:putative endonuclease
LDKGKEAESRACRVLQQEGYQLVARNYSCRTGEIDIIMLDDDCLVFVEVRMRSNPGYGTGAETITPSKQQKLAKTAALFLQQHTKFRHSPCRFDVVSLGTTSRWQEPLIIKNAFQPTC